MPNPRRWVSYVQTVTSVAGSAGFVHRQDLVCPHAAHGLNGAGGPGEGDHVCLLGISETEQRFQVARRAEAGAAADPALLAGVSHSDYHFRADPVPVALRANRADRQPVILIAALVAEQQGSAAIVGNQKVRIA